MIAYFDCFSGISGDMTLGALIDLGISEKWLNDKLKTSIALTGFDIEVSSEKRKEINGKRVIVHVSDTKCSNDYASIKGIIQKSLLSCSVKKKSLDIFDRIAVAEAKIHGCLKENVHFHEIGGIDSIVDILGTMLCIEHLGIQKIIASKIPLGKGFVSSMHGIIPVPSPATVEILKDIPVYGTDIDFELVTPTGAAIIACLSESFGKMPKMKIQDVGYGAGKRNLKSIPNLLRIITGHLDTDKNKTHHFESLYLVETCIDDMNPELYGFLMDRLFQDGALDVYWIPVFMKKNRPGTMIQVLCKENVKKIIIERILSETTSLGVRSYEVERKTLFRETVNMKSSFGTIKVKKIINPDKSIRVVPEYEVCKKIAVENNIALQTVYNKINNEINEKF